MTNGRRFLLLMLADMLMLWCWHIAAVGICFLQPLLLNALSECPVYHMGRVVEKECTLGFKGLCFLSFLSHFLSPLMRGTTPLSCAGSYLVLFGCVCAGAG